MSEPKKSRLSDSDETEEDKEGCSPFSPDPSNILFHEGVKEEFTRIFVNGGSYMEPLESCVKRFPFENFPDPTLANLETIEGLLQFPPEGVSRESWMVDIESVVCPSDTELSWLNQLCASFEMAVDCESDLCLETLFEIAKSLFLYGTVNVLLRLVQNEYIFESLLGILISDPEIPLSLRVNHLEYLQRESALVTIPDPAVFSQIKSSLRLTYVKDSILARMLDDFSFQTFSQATHSLNIHIFEFLNQTPFLGELIDSMPSDFLLGFLASIRTAESIFSDPKVVDFLASQVSSPVATDLLLNICSGNSLANNPCLRKHVLATLGSSKSESELLAVAELVRVVFLNDATIFRDLISIIKDDDDPNSLLHQVIFDLLSLQTFKMDSILESKILHALRNSHNIFTQLAAIRLVRVFIQSGPFHSPLIVTELVHLLDQNAPKSNMVYSSVLEIFTFICVNNIAKIFVESDFEIFKKLECTSVCAHTEICQFILNRNSVDNETIGRKRSLEEAGHR